MIAANLTEIEDIRGAMDGTSLGWREPRIDRVGGMGEPRGTCYNNNPSVSSPCDNPGVYCWLVSTLR